MLNYMQTDLEERTLNPYPLLPAKMQSCINAIPPELIYLEEDELLKIYTPNLNDRLMRQNFWNEYFRASNADSKKMLMNRIYDGVVGADTFHDRVIVNPKRLAFMLTPPKSYKTAMTNLLDVALTRYYEILSLPIKKRNGETDGVVVNAIIKAGAMIREAIYGQAVQRNVNINADVPEVGSIQSADDIDKKILELKSKLETKVLEIDNESKKTTSDS